MAGEDRELIFFVLSSLMVAEERITTKFSGLVGAYGSRGGGDVPRRPSRSTRLGTCSSTRASRTRSSRRPRLIAAHVERARAQRLRRLPAHLRRGARRRARAARRRTAEPVRQGPLRDDLPPDPREHARADDLQVHHRLPRARGPASRLRRWLLEDPPRRDPPHRLRRLVPARDGPRAAGRGRHRASDAPRPAALRRGLARAAGYRLRSRLRRDRRHRRGDPRVRARRASPAGSTSSACRSGRSRRESADPRRRRSAPRRASRSARGRRRRAPACGRHRGGSQRTTLYSSPHARPSSITRQCSSGIPPPPENSCR